MTLRLLFLSWRVDGFRATRRRIWARFFGQECCYVFVRYPKRPSTPVELPVEINGVVVRDMQEGDLADLRVERHQPRGAYRISDAVVATRQGRIVGAAWYADLGAESAQLPWHGAVERHLIPPARLTVNIFVVAGDKAAAWAIAKSATDRLATTGVRTIVGLVRPDNQRSILISRLLGAKMVARMSVRRWFGCRSTVVEPIGEDRDTAITRSGNTGFAA